MALQTDNEKRLAECLDKIITSWHWNAAWSPNKITKTSFSKRIQEAKDLLKKLNEEE
jgi:hypothetical protein